PGDIADRRLPAAPPDLVGKAPGEVRIVSQKVQALALHATAVATIEAPHLQLQPYPVASARQVADLANPTVVPALLRSPAAAADSFFERRCRLTMRTSGSPNTPRTKKLSAAAAGERRR